MKACQHCGKVVKGLKMHLQAKHPEDTTAWEPWVYGPDFVWRPASVVKRIEEATQR